MTRNNIKQFGAVSLFIVVFSALLITIVVIGFVSIMVQDQQQASMTDLSQSAYDSAQAGIEDAKRALVRYQTICDSGGDCTKAASDIDSSSPTATCNSAVETLNDVKNVITPNGVPIQTGGTNLLDQSYTCVKINLNTIDFLGSLSANSYSFIPLTSIGTFNTVQIQWFSSSNLNSNSNFDIDLQNPATQSKLLPLLSQISWKQNRPSIMQVQLIQFGSNGFTLNDFNNEDSTSESNANTLFLYPVGNTGTISSKIDTFAFSNRDIRRTQTGTPLPVTCSGVLSTGGYACTVKLTLPTPIGNGTNNDNRTAFLQLSSLYNNSDYRITLLNVVGDGATSTSTPVKFSAVQPEIDSTGRANDLFRRIQARVVLFDTNFPYPEAAVDTIGNLCKDFIVTDNVADYSTKGCTP
jgi:Tfp pilus assembly protein PilX